MAHFLHRKCALIVRVVMGIKSHQTTVVQFLTLEFGGRPPITIDFAIQQTIAREMRKRP